jgi:hypothetical protein
VTLAKNVIEINGKRYDARTGHLIESNPHKPATAVHAGGSIDGMTLRNSSTKREHAPKHLQHHAPARSKTLLRAAVKKPAKALKLAPMQHNEQPVFGDPTPLDGPVAIPRARLERARRIERSGLVQRFAASDLSAPVLRSVVKRTAHLPVKPAPAEHHHDSAQRTRGTAVHQATHRSIIDESLARARSHVSSHASRRPKTHQRIARKLRIKSRTLAIGASVVVALLIGGFVAYQNIPSLEMRVAASRAGFDASLPKWSPSGFALAGPIDYKKGEVALKYEVPTDDREFELVQKPSDWTPDTLLNNYVVEATDQYQTYHDKGLTVYIYDGSNATWVDRGVWYKLEGNSQLSGEQIIDLASSL